MYLFFDTETNGLPKDYKLPASYIDNWPRVIQLAWRLMDADGTIIDERASRIFQDGWEVPHEPFWIDKGITTMLCAMDGNPIVGELDFLLNAMLRAKYLIAHNVGFDLPVIECELHRIGAEMPKLIKFCTMLNTTSLCALPSANAYYGGYKWPKLQELHLFLFGAEFDGAHDAMSDVDATSRCFFELKKRGLISI